MHLTAFETDAQTVTAGYRCPCGCAPSVTHERGGERARSLCCCGNENVVGPDAERSLQPRNGFVLETERRTSGWGEPVTAAWLVGPSVHSDPVGATHGHDHDPAGATAIDPVCGMRVEPATAEEKGLHGQHEGVDYHFCGRGCYFDFGDLPARLLDPSYARRCRRCPTTGHSTSFGSPRRHACPKAGSSTDSVARRPGWRQPSARMTGWP